MSQISGLLLLFLVAYGIGSAILYLNRGDKDAREIAAKASGDMSGTALLGCIGFFILVSLLGVVGWLIGLFE